MIRIITFIGGMVTGIAALGALAWFADEHVRDQELESPEDNTDDGCLKS